MKYNIKSRETVSLGGRKYGSLDKTLKEVYKVTGLHTTYLLIIWK